MMTAQLLLTYTSGRLYNLGLFALYVYTYVPF